MKRELSLSESNLNWTLRPETTPSLPVLAWVARIHYPLIEVLCGMSVRTAETHVFEGSWAGEGAPESVVRSTTVFGSGLFLSDGELLIVPPSHTLEPVYWATVPSGLIASNSLVGLLRATGRELAPDVRYPSIFGQINRGLSHATIEIPTTTEPVTVHYNENIAVAADGTTQLRLKPREAPFENFADYRDRLVARVRSIFANAPDYEPLATLSSGYDSTASTSIGFHAGLKRAVTFRNGWPWRGYHGEDDGGYAAAAALGLSIETFDRLAYLALDDAPEAEFLASGMSGEDVVYRSMEAALPRTMLLTGYWGGAAWRGNARPELSRTDLSGASLGEFRLQQDFIHLPVPYIGGIEQPSISRLRSSTEMLPFSVGGLYDEPIARRIAEEAGVRRGTFGMQKLAASQRINAYGLDALSASTRASLEDFYGHEELARIPRRRQISRPEKMAMKLAHMAHIDWLTSGIAARRREAVQLEPVLGSLLLRWAVARLAPRYEVVAGFADG